MPLNGALILAFDGAVDPLTVDEDSLQAIGPDGQPLAVEVSVESGRLVLRPVVTPTLLARVPVTLEVRMRGGPSPRGLRTVDGRPLAAGRSLVIPLEARLEDEEGAAPRLLAVQGRPPAATAELASDGRLTLVFDGVLDPAQLAPAQCALHPVVSDLVLDEVVLPEVDWRCVGRRFELVLQLTPASGPLQLSLRRTGLRGLTGRAVEPALVIEVRPG